MILQGPSGSSSGAYFQDSDTIPQSSVINAIGLCVGSSVSGITIKYTVSGSTKYLTRGMSCADTIWLTLAPGEFITGFSGSYSGSVNFGQLTIYTNQRRWPQLGTCRPTPISAT